MMNKKPIFALNLATLVIALGYSLILPVMPFYMENLGAGGRELGWLTAVYALAQTVCAPFGVHCLTELVESRLSALVL
ncbi:hypothetical protein LC724_19150 [Blautia sp. RD014234]|nr:hypothetical protein [Blautia parvula]